jgi:DNA polymerase-1
MSLRSKKKQNSSTEKTWDEHGKHAKQFVLIDGHSVLFRAFHAYPTLTTSKGELINAVYGFTNILLTVIQELNPTHIAVSFDRAAPTFRHKEYKGYKAHRPEAPEELVNQQDRVEEVVSVLNIPIFAEEGYEADDVIGTLVKQACKFEIRNSKFEIIIVTSDRDALQLVDDRRVFVYTPGRGKQRAQLWDADAVVEKYGLQPAQFISLKALAGDQSDEIPGVRGIGPKTATLLLQAYGDLEGVYTHSEDVKKRFGEAVARRLSEGKESADLSRRLATIVTDVPITLSLTACAVNDYDKAKVVEKFKELEFHSLILKLPNDSFEQMVQEEIFN